MRRQWRRFHRLSSALMEALEQWRGSFREMQPLDLSALIPNLEAVCTELDLRFEEIERMLTGNPPAYTLQALALRLKNLVDVRKHSQASLLVRELLDDMRAWRVAIETLFQNWSDDPASIPDDNLQNRLAVKVKEMETRINRTLSMVEQGELSEQDYKNFYRLIGSYRGLSESIAEHAKLAKGIDWVEWKEARF